MKINQASFQFQLSATLCWDAGLHLTCFSHETSYYFMLTLIEMMPIGSQRALAYLFAELARPGDRELIFKVIESSCHLLLPV